MVDARENVPFVKVMAVRARSRVRSPRVSVLFHWSRPTKVMVAPRETMAAASFTRFALATVPMSLRVSAASPISIADVPESLPSSIKVKVPPLMSVPPA